MLEIITNLSDPRLDYVKDDPVRPELSKEFRVGANRFVVYLGTERPKAIVCVSLVSNVPKNVDELICNVNNTRIATFYTIWSYEPGAGSELLLLAVDRIRQDFPFIERFVTLSPKTEMARRFHIKNGAKIFRENETTINYEYQSEKINSQFK